MELRNRSLGLALCIALIPTLSQAVVISGSISGWPESGPVYSFGDGINHVSLWWSVYDYDRGWFYGRNLNGDSNVAFASGVTDISQVADASTYSYTAGAIGPYGDANANPNGIGHFCAWRNVNTGHYGVLRIDDIYLVDPNNLETAHNTALNGTWWFQTDGTGNFSPVPEPSSVAALFAGTAWLGVLLRRKRLGP